MSMKYFDEARNDVVSAISYGYDGRHYEDYKRDGNFSHLVFDSLYSAISKLIALAPRDGSVIVLQSTHWAPKDKVEKILGKYTWAFPVGFYDRILVRKENDFCIQ